MIIEEGTHSVVPVVGVTRVDGSQVHKVDATNVWLRDLTQSGSRSVRITFAIPDFGAPLRFVELLEVERQAGMAAISEYLDLPVTDVLSLNSITLSFTASDGQLEKMRHGLVDARIDGVSQGGKRTRAVTETFTIWADGQAQAHGRLSASFIPAHAYHRLRPMKTEGGRATTRPTAGEERFRQSLLIDREDPILRDHESDHLTAMALACAVSRTAQTLRPGATLQSLDMQFAAYMGSTPSAILEGSLKDQTLEGAVVQGGTRRASFQAQLSSVAIRRSGG